MYICPSTSDLNIWVWQFLPLKTANRSSNIKQKKQHPHTWHANVANGALRILCTWARQKEGQLWTTHMPRIGKHTWFPGIGSVVSHLAAELLAQQKKYVDKWRDVCWGLHLQLRNYTSCKLSSCKFCYGDMVALIRGYVTQLLGYKVQETSMASTIFH